jgi:hypothetical protein
MIRVAGYVLSAIVASASYVIWTAAWPAAPGAFSIRLPVALYLFLSGGFSAATIFMTLPWILIVWIYRKARLPGAVYFTCAGAMLAVVVSSAASSLSPRLFFIEDQTFLQGVLIALERQGVCFALAGSIIGLGYWFCAEKVITRRDRNRSNSIRSFLCD